MTDPAELSDLAIKMFQREIHRQAEFATVAIRDVEVIVNSDQPDSIRFWYAMDAALGAIARLSDILWPAKNRGPDVAKVRARGQALRARFGIGESTYLADKSVRNSLEHFAERMDDWAEKTSGAGFLDSHIGPLRNVRGVNEHDIARVFDTDTAIVRVFDQSLDIRATMAELASIEVLVPDPDEVSW
ncbi:hypothetical protein ITJ57_08300 [Plantibacter sp. VKM Ac-2880]|uniref:hypothetical protein n=1 Tax=Plantibacter sp. VKM Ac-2880 TaxID=2783827 RepID=UPI00188E50B0|nr:hypothetical protein [Plantibacter sp. VKM Ac-2880]MBF4568771.1 hypothetical protein [Plantibacter sp. VKM Ac-2880]